MRNNSASYINYTNGSDTSAILNNSSSSDPLNVLNTLSKVSVKHDIKKKFFNPITKKETTLKLDR